MHAPETFWMSIWRQFCKRRLGYAAFYVVLLFVFVGVYAPFLASSKPLYVYYEGQWYFPLFRYLFYPGFYTKRLDIFFNLLIFTLPLAWLSWRFLKRYPYGRTAALVALALLQTIAFLYICLRTPRDPASDPVLNLQKQQALKSHPLPNWNFELSYMNPYAKLNLIVREQLWQDQQKRLMAYSQAYAKEAQAHGRQVSLPTLWQEEQNREALDIARAQKNLAQAAPASQDYQLAQATIHYIQDRRRWIDEQIPKLHYEVLPLLRTFHWEDDAGGELALNQQVPWWEATRINRKDFSAALIFGVRISLVVGLIAVAIALAIGIPIGACAGYYGGTLDIIVCRLLEIWESMPTFFMLLLVVSMTQTKSIFLVITVIGVFGWTGFSRYIRGEFFKQRNLPYVEACHALGFRDGYVMFTHILPNAIPPLLTLLPFAIMGAITSEAGLSFLGLGEEGSCSWGVLMDEGRTAFPSESYLLWPPAILLTILLVAIALVGDALRDALDPKLQR